MNVTLWTDYSAAGGQRLGTLVLVDGTERQRIDGNETTTLTVGRKRWLDLGGDVRMVVRVVWPDGSIVERRIAQVETTDTAPVTGLTLVPVFADLANGGPILRVVAGRVATRVAGELDVVTALTTYVVPHSAATRLGLVLGTIEKNPVVQFDLDAPTPAAFLLDLFDKAKLEAEWVRTSDTVWTLHGRARRGSTVPALRITEARNQARLALAVDEQQLATVVVPFGDADSNGDRATIATARWQVAGIVAGGWVQLRDPDNASRTPILVDTQWQGAYVRDRSGVNEQILNSRASDGAVQLASTTGLGIGSRVFLASDPAGTPLVEVYDTAAVGSRRRVVPLTLSGVRGDANEIRNGRFADGLTDWGAANPTTPPSFVEIPRSELGVTRNAQADGARAANTGTGTPFAVKGLPANSFVRQWAELRVGGATLQVSADAIPDIGGGLTLSVTPGLPGAYVDDTPFTLIRREQRTLLLDGAQSVLLTRLRFQDSNTDGLLVGVSGTVTAAVGGWVSFPLTLRYATPGVQAGALVMQQPNLTVPALSTLPLLFNVQSATVPTPTGATTATLPFSASSSAITVGTTRLRYRFTNNELCVCRVTANSGGILTLELESHAAFGTPNPTFSGGFYQYEACDQVLANGSTWTLDITRETRTLRCNGPQTAGALSVPFKAQTNITTRNWGSGDTISLNRSLSATLALTGVTSYTPSPGGNTLVVTYDAATSTMDDLTTPDDWGFGDVWFDFGSGGTFRLDSIGGGTASFVGSGGSPTTPQTATATWTKVDTYALTGSASWGANGRVTLTLAAAVPTGRSYARGLPVNANWVTGAMRLHVALSAGATSVQLAGVDFFVTGSDPAASLRGAVYRIQATVSTIPIPGNTLYAASTVQANGSGVASVPLVAANPNAIANNEAVTIVTPQMLRPSDPTTGSVVRLTSAAGGGSHPSISALTTLTGVPVTVPAGTTVPVTVFVTLSLSAGSYSLSSQPSVALVDGAGTVLQTGSIASTNVTVAQTPTIVRVILQRTLTESATLFVRMAGRNNDRAIWITPLDAMLVIGADDDVPFVAGSWANELAIRGAEELAARRDPAVAVTLDLATLRRWSDAPAGVPVVVGQTVELPALGLTRRVLTIDRSLTDPDRVRVEVGVQTDQLTTQVGQLLSGAS